MKPRNLRWLAGRDQSGQAILIFLLGMATLILVLGFLAVDTYRLISIDRDLSAAVDGAAAAGANGIDEQAYRDSGAVQLDPGRAEAFAADTLGVQPHAGEMVNVTIVADVDRITVTAERPVQLLLLRFIGDPGRTVRAGAEATPRRSP